MGRAESTTDVPPASEAVTFDFFNTLVFHRDGRGRGKLLMEYLERHGLEPSPWEHAVLYDIFGPHAATYSPSAPRSQKMAYYAALAQRIFRRLNIRATAAEAATHAEALWEILGPSSFGLFPDTLAALQRLEDHGIPLAVVSNWQSGLGHFCTELGLGGYFRHVLSSADVGIEKPDPGIFLEACRRLNVPPDRTLHVGDSHLDDYVGAASAGLQAVLIDRSGRQGEAAKTVRSLHEVVELVAGP